MDKFFSFLKNGLGPNPLFSLCILITTVLAILASFKVVPSLPPGFAYVFLGLLVVSANLYWGWNIARLWPRAVGGVDGHWSLRSRSQARIVDGTITGIPALEELSKLTGLDIVKSEISTLIQRLQIEAARRERGSPITPISMHMVFAGPPGTGKNVDHTIDLPATLRRGVKIDEEVAAFGYPLLVS